MKRLPLTHLLLIAAILIALAAAAWLYTSANEPVEGVPSIGVQDQQPLAVLQTKQACEAAGGIWNACASACPPGTEVCTQVCVQKCEFPKAPSGKIPQP